MNRVRSLLRSNSEILIVVFALSATTFTMGLIQPVLPLYAQSLGASVEQYGLIATMWGIAMALGEPVWGRVHDRIDRLLPLFFRMASGTVVFLLFPLVPFVWPLYLLNFWRGFSDATSWPTGRSLVSRAAPLARIGLAMGFLSTGARIGSAMGAFTGGQVANAYGYRPAFVVAALVTLSVSLLVVPRFGWPKRESLSRLFRPGRIHRPRQAPSRHNTLQALQRNRPFITLSGVTVLASVGWFGPMTFLPFVVTSSLQGNVVEVGILFNVYSITTALFTIPMGGLGDKVGRRRMVIAGLVAGALCLAGVAWTRSFVQLLALIAGLAVAQAAVRPSMDALVSNTASLASRGQTMGLYGMCEDMGGIFGPALGSLAWRLGGPAATFLTFSAIAGAATLTALAAVRDRHGFAAAQTSPRGPDRTAPPEPGTVRTGK
jgi:MFS family permease